MSTDFDRCTRSSSVSQVRGLETPLHQSLRQLKMTETTVFRAETDDHIKEIIQMLFYAFMPTSTAPDKEKEKEEARMKEIKEANPVLGRLKDAKESVCGSVCIRMSQNIRGKHSGCVK
jgi:hypothetical protein